MKTMSKILLIFLGLAVSGVIIIFSLSLAQGVFYLNYYCVPEKVFQEEDRDQNRRLHDGYDQDCKNNEIKKQFRKYTLFSKDKPFAVGDIIAYRRNGKLFNKSFGRIKKVNTLEKGWSYEVLIVSDGQISTGKVMHNWIFARD